MFGKDKGQDGSDEGQAVPVSVTPASTDDTTTPPASPQDELNLPAPAMTASALADDMGGAPEVAAPAPAPMAASMPEPTAEPVPDEELAYAPITINTSGTMKDLGSLKQEALHELSPLINQLDQTPDEKYDTAKMVYEETNDQAILTSVYEAAKNLPDEKAKAEAIYDVIKKINEFSEKN